MPDVVDQETRSRMMSGIKGKNTRPEIAVRKALHALGFRYRLHPKDVPGKPDIVLPAYRAAIFVHGCFWHGHDCSLFRLPATRPEFWQAKIDANRARDTVVLEKLVTAGLRSLVIWECAFRGPGQIGLPSAIAQAAAWLRSGTGPEEIRGTM